MADDLDRMSETQLLREAVRELRTVHSRLDAGGDRMARIEADLTICVRAVQLTLLEKATKLQVVRSLAEVGEVLKRLEAEASDRETMPPDEVTAVNNPPPVRDTQPSPPPGEQ